MALYRVADDGLERVPETTFIKESFRERNDIQRLLKSDVSVLTPDLMVIAEEFGDWVESSRRIDLLCLGRDASLVVVELKRTEDGGHMELQAIRYAAMVSSMTFEQLTAAHGRFIGGDEAMQRAEAALLNFLGWTTASDGVLSGNVRIILVSANFGVELTTAVIWLNKQGLDISCFRLKPHRLGNELLIDIEQIIPLPEAADYEIKLRAQRQETQRVVSARGEIFRRFWAQLIDRSRSKTNVVAGRSTTTDHWLTGSIGKAGFNPTFTMRQNDSRVELYVDLGKSAELQTMAAFDELYAQKAAVEASFGEELEWQPLPDSRGCRICKTVAGGWKASEADWGELQDRLIETMVRLERALREPVTRLAATRR